MEKAVKGAETAMAGTIDLLQGLAPDYEVLTQSKEVTFQAGQLVTFNNRLFVCVEEHSSQVWSEDKWTECTIDAVLDSLMDAMSKISTDVQALEETGSYDKHFTSTLYGAGYAVSNWNTQAIFFTAPRNGVIHNVQIWNRTDAQGGTLLRAYLCQVPPSLNHSGYAEGIIVAASSTMAWPSYSANNPIVTISFMGEDGNPVEVSQGTSYYIAFDLDSRSTDYAVGQKVFVNNFQVFGTRVYLRIPRQYDFASYDADSKTCVYTPLLSISFKTGAEPQTTRSLAKCMVASMSVSSGQKLPMPNNVAEVRYVLSAPASDAEVDFGFAENDFIAPGLNNWNTVPAGSARPYIFSYMGKTFSGKRMWLVNAPIVNS
jgi:hypothetical protein